MRFSILLLTVLSLSLNLKGQNFDYTISLNEVNITNLTGIHSYAYGQHESKWLIVGGRLDGLHPRTPNTSFPENQNNTDLYVIDPINEQFWSAPLSTLPTGIQEQLQSTNMNFHQSGDTLYIIGGYAYSQTAVDHITFPNLTSIIVSSTIDAIINNTSFTGYFQQISDQEFAITGGQMGYLDGTFYLVGGHRFDGRYNPMNGPSYTQTYHTGYKTFELSNATGNLSYSNLNQTIDAVHLRRRDYNLVPQVFPDKSLGYTISSGVFQDVVNLPFLYPVDITTTGYTPQTTFNQYLSNYHSAKVGLYDSIDNRMHSIFFGGLSQYYYDSGTLIQDDNVPFVKTVSMVSRESDGSLTEYQLPLEMPTLKGAGAEFIPNNAVSYYDNGVFNLNQVGTDSVLVGWIYGGIESTTLNPFTDNTLENTNADATIYEVWIKQSFSNVDVIDGTNPYQFDVHPNIIENEIQLTFNKSGASHIDYYISTLEGKIVSQEHNLPLESSNSKKVIQRPPNASEGIYFVTVVFDGVFFATKKVVFK